jgi:hypothetical protein
MDDRTNLLLGKSNTDRRPDLIKKQPLWRTMRTFWKSYHVYFLVQQTLPHLDVTIRSYV